MTETRQLGIRFFDEVLGTGDWARAEELTSPEIVMHHPSSPEPIRGREAVCGFLAAFRAGFPDMTMTVDDSFAGDDKVAVRWHMTGTHTAVLFGIPPTGKHALVKGVSIFRVADGKIVEDWVQEDTHGLMVQLGLAPA
jgi:steroid delta-isomerase-like uncharacterized protein